MTMLNGCNAYPVARDHTLSVIGVPTLEQEVQLPDGTIYPPERRGPQLTYFEQGSSNEGCFIQITAAAASDLVDAVTEEPVGTAPTWSLDDAGYFVIRAPNGELAGLYDHREFRDFDGVLYRSLDTDQLNDQIEQVTSSYGCDWR